MTAIEITTFKLNGCNCAAFIAGNADVDAWLQRQSGFLSRHIAERDDGTIVDMLLWNSVAEGGDAMARLMIELADSPVHALIDQSTVSWTIAQVRHQLR